MQYHLILLVKRFWICMRFIVLDYSHYNRSNFFNSLWIPWAKLQYILKKSLKKKHQQIMGSDWRREFVLIDTILERILKSEISVNLLDFSLGRLNFNFWSNYQWSLIPARILTHLETSFCLNVSIEQNRVPWAGRDPWESSNSALHRAA